LVVHLDSGSGDQVQAAFGEDVEAEVAASFCPFVGLFGKDCADEADDRVTVGEDADAVGAAADLSVEALARVVGPDLLPEPVGEACEREDVSTCGVRCSNASGSLLST
jgi:hypothetical protein